MAELDCKTMSDHDILVKIATDVQDLKRAVEGNGQPGLVTRVALIEGETRSQKKSAVGGGAAGSAITLVFTAILRSLGWL